MSLPCDSNRLQDNEVVKDPNLLDDYLRLLRCPTCSLITTSLSSLPCHHSLCNSCISDLVQSDSDLLCAEPKCQQPFVNSDVKPATGLNEFVANLHVHCSTTGWENGCEWKGALLSREDHISNCDYQPVVCPHEGCTEQPQRRDLEAHAADCGFRIVACCHVGCSSEFQQQDEDGRAAHEDHCEAKPVICDLCSETVCKGVLETHKLLDCGEVSVSCAENTRKELVANYTKRSREETTSQTEELSCDTKSVIEDVSLFARKCLWEGKRRKLSDHRKACVTHGMSTLVTRLQVQALKTREVSNLKQSIEDLRQQIGNLNHQVGELQDSLKAVLSREEQDDKMKESLQSQLFTNQCLVEQQDIALGNLQEMIRRTCTFVWDIQSVNPRRYRQGDCVKSPRFNLYGRTWQVDLYPAGGDSKAVEVYLNLLELRNGESLEVKGTIRCGEKACFPTVTYTYSLDKSSWGYKNFCPIPSLKFDPLEVEIESVAAASRENK